jgi:YgiT-type zinc finger domain-containing protein
MKMSGSTAGGGNRMGPGECLLCKSKMREGTTEFVARVGEQVVVIKNIPAFVCPNCDEAYYTIDTQRKIDSIMKAFHEGKLLAKSLAAGEVDLMALETCQPATRATIEDL